jgi:flavin-dependent dehydrogenase
MKIAICGAGLVGSYLYRLLNRCGTHQITVFDKQNPYITSCGINPCAWVTSIGFKDLIEEVNLNPKKYILQTFNRTLMNEMNITAEIMVIDKPKLITDLLAGTDVKYTSIKKEDFERIIDATGFARAYLPKIDNDIVASCIQYRVYSKKPLDCSINISNIGYVWCFPLSDTEYHIGAGSIRVPPEQMLGKLGWVEDCDHLCSCASRIRFTSPHYSLPFVEILKGKNHISVWGIGEAIGCVTPLAGEGIIPGLKSARLLLDNWDDPDAYQYSILREFLWMKKERSVIDKVIKGRSINLFDARILKNNTRRLGMKLGSYQALKILKSMTKLD